MSYLVATVNDFMVAAADDYLVTADLSEGELVLGTDTFLVNNTSDFLVIDEGWTIPEGGMTLGPVPGINVRLGAIGVSRARAGGLLIWESSPPAVEDITTGLIWHSPTNDGTGTTVTATVGTNATISGAVGWTTGPKGVVGTAIEATTDSSIARVPQATSPKPSTAVSISFWLRRTGAKANASIVWMPAASPVMPYVSYGMAFDSTGGTNVGLYLGINGILQYFFGTSSTLNTWELWTGTWASGARLQTFKNGSFQAESTATHTGALSYYNQDLCLCGTTNYIDRWVVGQVANVRIYDRALTQAEILTIYDLEKP